MVKIWTMGELLVEIMRTEVDCELYEPAGFRGPFPSGAPAIFIDTIARLGGKAGIIGAIGTDDFGKCLLDRLKHDQVDCSHIAIIEHGLTGVAFVMYRTKGDRKFIFHLENSCAVEMKTPKHLPVTDLFHIMGCSLTINDAIYKEIIGTMDQYVKRGTKISFDPNIRVELLKGRSMSSFISKIMENCSFLLPGVDELLMISGQKTIESAVETLFKNPVLEVIALKRGKHGCTIFTRDSRRSFGIYDIPPLDATGAGDCFDGAFLYSYLSGNSLEECIKIATAAASINTGAFGPMEGKISPQKIETVIQTAPYLEL